MDAYFDFFSKEKSIIIYEQSSHYPHIEEHERFTTCLNEFFESV